MLRIVRLTAIIGLLALASAAQADGDGKSRPDPLFAIAAEASDTAAEISKIAGIAPYYHLYDEAGELVEVVANRFLELDTGTGKAAGEMLVEMGVSVLIARQVPGPKLKELLDGAEVRSVRRIGIVQDVVDELKE